MKRVKLICPVCCEYSYDKSYLDWLFGTPINWILRRKTKCPVCDTYSYMKRMDK